MWSLINGKEDDPIPATQFCVGIDVRDVAELHVKAVENPAAKDVRLLTIAWHIFNSEVVEILRKTFAGDKAKYQRIPSNGGDPVYPHFDSDSNEAETILGHPWISAEKSVVDSANRLWEIEAEINGKK